MRHRTSSLLTNKEQNTTAAWRETPAGGCEEPPRWSRACLALDTDVRRGSLSGQKVWVDVIENTDYHFILKRDREREKKTVHAV